MVISAGKGVWTELLGNAVGSDHMDACIGKIYQTVH